MFKVKSFYNQAVRTLGGLGLSNRPLDLSKTAPSLLQLRPLVALDVLEAPPENTQKIRNDLNYLNKIHKSSSDKLPFLILSSD